jgi:hypothetical protein
MLKSLLIAIVGFFIITEVLLNSDGVHLPILSIMIIALIIGFINPNKGWIIAICLIICLLIFGFYFEQLNLSPKDPKIISFICNISFLPILFGGFMGRYFKKALK